MPTYTFIDEKTGREWTEMMSISELDEYLYTHPDTKQGVSAPSIVSGVASGKNKPSDGFRDVLRDIKKKNSRGLRRSTINTY